MRPLVSQRPERLSTLPPVKPAPETEAQPLALWVQPKGIDSFHVATQVGGDYATDLTNYCFEDGQLRSRNGTNLLGNAAASTVVQTTDFFRPTGKKVTIRFCTRHIEVFNYSNGLWRSFAIDLHGDVNDMFTWTGWGDRLLFSNFHDGLWELDFQTYIVQKIPGAPGTKHLQTFAGRVIASCVSTYAGVFIFRIQWSVNRDYRDWTGQGSGFEDLYAAPGGVVDEVMHTEPLTDEAALVVRTKTCWQMSVSGIADAPFRFSRVLSFGSPFRYSIVLTNQGVVFLGTTSFYLVTMGSPLASRIGDLVMKRFHENMDEFAKKLYAVYDSERDEYRIAGGPFVYRFKFLEGGWTKDRYPWEINSLGQQVPGKTGYPIDSLVGTIDSLPGTNANSGPTIDDLVAERLDDKRIFLVPRDSLVTLSEEWTTVDYLPDGTFVDSNMEIVSGVLTLDAHKSIELIGSDFEYSEEEEQDVSFWYSLDGNLTRTQIKTETLPISTGSDIVRVFNDQVHRRTQLIITSPKLGALRIWSFIAHAVRVERP